MKRIIFILLFIPVLVSGQITQQQVKDTTALRVKSPISAPNIKASIDFLTRFANQGDSISRVAAGWGNHAGLYVTTNTAQTGLTGNKSTSGKWTFTGGQLDIGTSNNGVINFPTGGGNDPYTIGNTNGSFEINALNADNININTYGHINNRVHGEGSSFNWGIVDSNNNAMTLNDAGLQIKYGKLRIGSGGFDSNQLYVDGETYLNSNTLTKAVYPIAHLAYSFGSPTRTWSNGYISTSYNTNIRALDATGVSLKNNGNTTGLLVNNSARTLIQNGGTFTDSNEQLQVVGTTKLDGAVRSTGLQTLSSTSAGVKMFRTATETVNTEYATLGWAVPTSAFEINTKKEGTGANRGIRINSAAQVEIYAASTAVISSTGTAALIGGSNTNVSNYDDDGAINISTSGSGGKVKISSEYDGGIEFYTGSGTGEDAIFGLGYTMFPNGNSRFGSNTTNPGIKLRVDGAVGADQLRVNDMNTAPVSATATGVKGEVRFTTTGIFICTATNTWIKCVGATF